TGDDLVPLAPAQLAHPEMERRGAARDGYRVAVAEPVGEVMLELLQLRPEGEHAGADHFQPQLLLARAELRSCERDLFGHSPGCPDVVAGRRTRANRRAVPR